LYDILQYQALFFRKEHIMGKSLKGKELGTGITQRKDGRYSAKFKSKSGKRIERYFNKLAEARKWLADAKYEDSHGSISSSTDMTVDAWFNYWIDEKSKTTRYNTVRNYTDRYQHNIQKLIGSMVMDDVKPVHCQNVLNVMDSEGYAGSTMVNTRVTMAAMFSDAKEHRAMKENPVTKSVKCPKKKEQDAKALSLDEEKKLLSMAKSSIHYPAFAFVLQTGLRSSELRGLQWGDVDFQNGMIHITHNTTYDYVNKKFVTDEPKTRSGKRDIPLTQEACNLLMKIRQNKAKRKILSIEFADHVFLNQKGSLTTNSSYNKCLERLCLKAGIEKVSIHELRHTFATRAVESGMDAKTLQVILGHSDISITMNLYVHSMDDEKRMQMQKFEQMYRMA